MMHGFGFGGFGWIGIIIYFVVSVLVLAGVLWLILWIAQKYFSGNYGITKPDVSPREIIMARYARGEITREQYEIMKADLAE